MINSILKTAQIILFVLFFTGGIGLLIGNISIKSKRFRRRRTTAGVISILASSLVMIILSMFIVNNNTIYENVNFPVFQQLWIIVKSTLLCYADLIICCILACGSYFIILIGINKARKPQDMFTVSQSIQHLPFTMIEKIMYFNLFYESKIRVIKHNDLILISKQAYSEFQLYREKHGKKNSDEK